MSGKGSISRMSDECLMKQETVVSFYTQYQAVMRKFTLARKSGDSTIIVIVAENGTKTTINADGTKTVETGTNSSGGSDGPSNEGGGPSSEG